MQTTLRFIFAAAIVSTAILGSGCNSTPPVSSAAFDGDDIQSTLLWLDTHAQQYLADQENALRLQVTHKQTREQIRRAVADNPVRWNVNVDSVSKEYIWLESSASR